MNFKENDLNCGKQPEEACTTDMDDYRRLQLLRDDQSLCERHFSVGDKGQEGEYKETVAVLQRLGCKYQEVFLEGVAFLFISKSDAALIDDPSRRSTIMRVLKRLL